jgi:hypothetical protein
MLQSMGPHPETRRKNSGFRLADAGRARMFFGWLANFARLAAAKSPDYLFILAV